MSSVRERLQEALSPRYEVRRELGSGGMASVYEAYDRSLARDVAIKVLRPELATAVGAERFLKEIRSLARLSHPNIVPIHDAAEEGGLFYYVMDLVRADTLKDRLRRRPLVPDEAVRVGTGLLQALDAVHAAGLVHRDVKPANLFLADDRVLLADFGVAKSLDPTGDELTEYGDFVGTPVYASPEQRAGHPVTPQTDLYAAGLLLYESLTGRRWISDVDPATGDWSGVPRPLRFVLKRALDPDPGRRWQGAMTFHDALLAAGEQYRESRVGPNRLLWGLSYVAGAWLLFRIFAWKGSEGQLGIAPAGWVAVALLPLVLLAGWKLLTRGRSWRLAGLLSLAGFMALGGFLIPDGAPVGSDATSAEVGEGVSGGVIVPPACLRSDDAGVVELYREGLTAWRFRPDSLPKAAERFQLASSRDPNYACAHAGLALIYTAYPARGFGIWNSAEAFENAREEIDLALALDSGLAQAHLALAEVRSAHDWDWAGADEAYRTAIALAPDDADAHLWHAHHLSAMGDTSLALRRARQADSLAPERPTTSAGLGVVLYHARRFDEASTQLARTLEDHPGFIEARLWHVGALLAGGRLGEAGLQLDMLADALGPPGSDPELVTYQAIVAAGYAGLDRDSRARRWLEPALATDEAYASRFWIGTAYAQLGHADSAMTWLEKAYEERDEFMRSVRVAPLLDPIREDPRFAELLGRMGYPEPP